MHLQPERRKPSAKADLTGLGAYTGAVDDHGVAALAQTAQERLGQRRVAEEVLPGRVHQAGRNQSRFLVMAFLHQLEEDVRLLILYVGESELIDRKDVYVGQRPQQMS